MTGALLDRVQVYEKPSGALLQRNEVAAFLGISPRALWNLHSRGVFPVKPIRLGHRWFWPRSELEKLVSSR